MESYGNNDINRETEYVEEIPADEENPYGQDFTNYQAAFVSKEEFLKNNVDFNRTVKTTAIVSYVLIALNTIAIFSSIFVIIDVLFLLGCTLGVHLKKKKGCAIAILIYGIFSVVVGLLSSAGPTGWMWIVIAVIYLQLFKTVEKQYKAIFNV